MELVKRKLKDIKPYPNNPRINEPAVDAVMESIKQCEYVAPIVVDENNMILAGHTRLKAMEKLGWKECEVVVKEGLTEEQKHKYRLLDNKTNELSEWDYALLKDELDGLDFGDLSDLFTAMDDNLLEQLLDEDFDEYKAQEKTEFTISIQFEIADRPFIDAYTEENGKDALRNLIREACGCG